MNDWCDHLARLADHLTHCGQLPARWSHTFRSVPRHVFVPRYYEQDNAGHWQPIDGTDPAQADRWLDGVYSDRTLITTLQAEHGPWGTQHIPVSSSTLPSLMLRMLDELDATGGNTVLEIGTGTGYNAALLATQLGDHNVYSVDIRDELVTEARARLASLDRYPTLVTVDGANGLPDSAPYDRILATCAARHVPPAWLDQLAPGGMIIADIKGGLSAGNLITLIRPTAQPYAEGRFLSWWAGFMTMVHNHTAPPPMTSPKRRAIATRTTPLSPLVLTIPVFAFLAQTQLPLTIQLRQRRTPDQHSTVLADTDTGHWTSINHQRDSDGYRVDHTGTDHWQIIENTHQFWLEHGEPEWQRFGLTMTPHTQHLWLDHPDSQHTWPLHPLTALPNTT